MMSEDEGPCGRGGERVGSEGREVRLAAQAVGGFQKSEGLDDEAETRWWRGLAAVISLALAG